MTGCKKMLDLALATSIRDLPNDADMPLLLSACKTLGLNVDVCAWDDPNVDWSAYRYVILRSTWDYTERLGTFLEWCEHVAAVTTLVNPLSVARWATDKHYLADLVGLGLPVVKSEFVEPGTIPLTALRSFLSSSIKNEEFVVKPTIGSQSKSIKRFSRAQEREAAEHIRLLLQEGLGVILQPYLKSVDCEGETNLIYFGGVFSHAIRKDALLMEDGTVNEPSAEFRAARVPREDEQDTASEILRAAADHLCLKQPLLYARVDLVRDDCGDPRLLELDICEPSLSLPFAQGSAMKFAEVLAKLVYS